VDDTRESPFFKLRDLLLAKGALLNVFDSWVTTENNVSSLEECLHRATAIVIVTEHSDILTQLRKTSFADLNVEIIVDGRNCLEEEEIRGQNVLYRGIGRRA
jgi:UDP-N-acetyl-D-mannosaminuronate dehydrogenase